jgi:hypothetical protein
MGATETLDVEELGPTSLRHGVQPLLQLSLDLVGAHDGSVSGCYIA